ncbi:MAG: succinate dehydrogenase, cytochrome b556 subunit [Candidatus Omnitrophica bacterium]|nr:succinate dehydrogenase, cytochrome b556 subunit [Candidatus Omnitrophota bacterium]
MTVYRGGIGQTSWLLHRITGVGVLIFLCLHILDTFLIMLGPEHYNSIIRIYRHPAFRVMEVGLFAAVLYHALNGVRIILIDFWVALARFHRQLFYAQMAGFVVTILPVAYLMLRPLWSR